MTKDEGTFDRENIMERLIGIMRQMPDDRLVELLKELDTSNEKDNRRHNRKVCEITVYYATHDRIFKSAAHDISTGGVFIQTEDTFYVGQEILLTFSFSDSQKPFTIQGVVVRRAGGGIGVKFIEINQEQQDVLQKFVKNLACDSSS